MNMGSMQKKILAELAANAVKNPVSTRIAVGENTFKEVGLNERNELIQYQSVKMNEKTYEQAAKIDKTSFAKLTALIGAGVGKKTVQEVVQE